MKLSECNKGLVVWFEHCGQNLIGHILGFLQMSDGNILVIVELPLTINDIDKPKTVTMRASHLESYQD
jgi:hypothetical protein